MDKREHPKIGFGPNDDIIDWMSPLLDCGLTKEERRAKLEEERKRWYDEKRGSVDAST